MSLGSFQLSEFKTKMLFIFFTFILSQVYSGVFQRLPGLYEAITLIANGMYVCILVFLIFVLLSNIENIDNYNPQRQKLFRVLIVKSIRGSKTKMFEIHCYVSFLLDYQCLQHFSHQHILSTLVNQCLLN